MRCSMSGRVFIVGNVSQDFLKIPIFPNDKMFIPYAAMQLLKKKFPVELKIFNGKPGTVSPFLSVVLLLHAVEIS